MRILCLTVLCGTMFIAMPSAARAQAPVIGQPYQVPFEFSGYGAGTLINYGGYNYVIQGDGTMLPAEDSGFTYSSQYGPPATVSYYVPFEFSGYGAGTLINYGGYNYVIQGDGTMLPAEDSGFTYSSQYGPPAAATYFLEQPAYNAWVDDQSGLYSQSCQP